MNKNKECRLAYEMFVYQVIKTIGSYVSVLNGLDDLVFTAKIGENVQGSGKTSAIIFIPGDKDRFCKKQS